MTMLSAKKKILLVEDDPHIAFSLELNLKEEGYDVTSVDNGLAAVDKYKNNGPFDLVILDIMVPEMDGFQVAKFIRSKDVKTGILILTARAADSDRIRGLEIGVDDYITKPFHLTELLLKVKRATQRVEMFEKGGEEAKSVIRCGAFELNRDALHLTTPNGSQTLTALEADILSEFMLNPNRVLSREHLLHKVWGMNGNFETRTVDNFIMRLRKILEEDPSAPKILESVRGRGYRFTLDSQTDKKT
jgi:two-component system alkaline phosphatase synthesis response regulator PhoP